MRRLFSALAVAALVMSACEPLAPDEDPRRADPGVPAAPSFSNSAGRTDEELTFARYVVLPAMMEASVLAVSGHPITLPVPYASLPGSPPLVEFQLGPESLPPGQAVLITVTVERLDPLDPLDRRFIFRFSPAGLTFSPHDPARLRLNYEGADPDVNGDGVVDKHDAALEHGFRVWYQAAPEQPWRQLPTKRLEGDVIEGRVTHFTGFAMAT